MKTSTKEIMIYHCEYCGFNVGGETNLEFITRHEIECLKNPSAKEYIKNLLKTARKQIFMESLRVFKDNEDFKRLLELTKNSQIKVQIENILLDLVSGIFYKIIRENKLILPTFCSHQKFITNTLKFLKKKLLKGN